jgi:hypothetical protein
MKCGNFQLTAWASRGKSFIPTNFKEHTIYLPFMIYQSFVCLVFVHSIFTYHKSYFFFDVEHESIGALALP